MEVKVKTMQGIHTFRRDRDENVLGIGREIWSQVQNPTPNTATKTYQQQNQP